MAYCMKCGYELPNDAKFCQRCGQSTENLNAASPSQYSQLPAYVPQRYTYVPRPSSAGTVLTVVSIILTCVGILLALFSDYLELTLKLGQFYIFSSSKSYGIGLFTAPDFLAKIQDILDLSGSEVPESLSRLTIVFVIWLIDIVFAAVMLIRRLMSLGSDPGRYISKIAYVPLTPMVMGLIFKAVLNSSDQNIISAEPTGAVYFMALLFIANIIISAVGRSFNSRSGSYVREGHYNQSEAEYAGSDRSTFTVSQDNDELDDYIFDSDDIDTIYVDPNNRYFRSDHGVLFNKNRTELIRFPAGKTGTPSERGLEYVIPDGVTSVHSFAFKNCKLDSIIIPSSVTQIGECSFCDCIELKSIKVSGSVNRISANAFSGCNKLEFVNLANGVSYIDEAAFSHCGNIIEITLPKSLKKIGEYAFSECNNIKDIYYNGNKTEWKNISISKFNNELLNAEMHTY